MTLPFTSVTLGQSQPMYLGKPGNMQKLRMPDTPYSSVAGRGEASHTLVSGGQVITRLPKTKRQWALPFSGMTEDTANILVAFYAGSMGMGPFVLVDPAWRNKFGASASSMGAVTISSNVGNLSTIAGWSASVTALNTISMGVTAVPGFAPFVESSYITVATTATNTKVGLGTWTGATLVPRTLDAPVYLFDQPCAASIYLRAVTGTPSISWQLNGVNAAGSVQLAGTTQTATLSSGAWTRFTSFLAAGNSNALYAIPTITGGTGGSTAYAMSCADFQYGPTNSTGLGAWVLGLGSPRVNLAPSSGSGFASITRLLPLRDQGIALVEI